MIALSSEIASGDQRDLDDDCIDNDDDFEPIFIGEDFNLYVWFASGEPFAGEHPIARITPTGIEYYLQDSMGSVIGATGSAGTSTAAIKYDSFGEVVDATGTAATSSAVGGDFRLHGMWLDEVSGLYHVRARTYDAATGRFLSRDPVDGDQQEPETYGTYALGRSNPNAWRDPSGLLASLAEVSAVQVAEMNLASIAIPAYLIYRTMALSSGLGWELHKEVEAVRDLDERRNRGRRPVLVRYGPGPETEDGLVAQAWESKVLTGNYGVSTFLRFREPSVDRNHRWAYIEDVLLFFKVRQTGAKRKDHFTVFLHEPIGTMSFIEQDTIAFNSIFVVH